VAAAPHEEVHALARQAVELNNQGRKDETRVRLQEMVAASEKIIAALEQLIAYKRNQHH